MPSQLYQKSSSAESTFNTLKIHDINNLKYSMTNGIDIKFNNGATLLIHHIESHRFFTAYKCNPVSENLDGLFFTNPTLLERAKRFPEVVLVDAMFNTNELKMPRICAFGVNNIGKETLKTFPIAFAWVASEKEQGFKIWVTQESQKEPKTTKHGSNY